MLVYWCNQSKKKNKQTNESKREKKGRFENGKKKSTRILSDELPKKNYQVLENHRAQHSPRTAANCSSIYKFLSLLIYSMCPSIM